MLSSAAPRIRALVVDDSAVARRMVSQALAELPEVEVVGQADSGAAALDHVRTDLPDVVVLDLEMPGMDGLDTLRQLKRHHPALPVLIFSAQSRRGAGAAVDAMLAGADDYALKPRVTNDFRETWAAVQLELSEKLRGLADKVRRAAAARSRPPGLPSSVTPLLPISGVPMSRVEAVVIGSSLGGPEALAVVLPRLRRDFPVPLFIVQHMPADFTGALAQRLANKSSLEVVEARQGQVARPGVVYLAPGNYHLQLARRHQHVTLSLDRGPLENGCRPAVDPLFRSAASVYGPGLLALVLTGMGSDGLLGAERVAALGGHVWIQDEQSSANWGMGGAIARAGLARRVVPLASVAALLEAAMTHGLPIAPPLVRPTGAP